jgi:RNA polymerase subunit RPABC4/transcription elongation factor Spt4
MSENENLVCLNCESVVKDSDEYCPNCGIVFAENIKCHLHKEAEAEGICLICSKLCCKKCGLLVSNVFLCNEHNEYEIIEGMAKIYGSNDGMELKYYEEILEKEGLHPFMYSRQSTSKPFGSVDYAVFWGESRNYSLNEIKLMMPLKEVLEAEKILEPLINDSEY